MKKTTITETKSRLSALIDLVRHGETVVITDRGRPVARLISAIDHAADDPDGRLARLERRGGLRRASTLPPRALILARFPAGTRRSGVLATLLEDRAQGP